MCFSIAETPVQEFPNSSAAAIRLTLASHGLKVFFSLIHTKWQALVNISIEKEHPQHWVTIRPVFKRQLQSARTDTCLVLSFPWKLLLNKFSGLPYPSSPKRYCLLFLSFWLVRTSLSFEWFKSYLIQLDLLRGKKIFINPNILIVHHINRAVLIQHFCWSLFFSSWLLFYLKNKQPKNFQYMLALLLSWE